MQLNTSVNLSQKIVLKHCFCLSVGFGETSGDIPLYSMHRISRRLQQKPPEIPDSLIRILSQSLIAANAVYRQNTGNNWNCLTSNNLVGAIGHVDRKLAGVMTVTRMRRPEDLETDQELKELLDKQRQEYLGLIKGWFKENYDELLYITNGKIPWAIIRRLERGLASWISGVINPFSEDIDQMVLMVAKEEGVIAESPEEAWQSLGGHLFRKRKRAK